ncbi:hypothetical protein NDU88_001125 [Pleurodeles waltl]|uniref:Uncharacterized protein n=1 Tax=Pleurodeles waltl TaxID=8319 RepID=A0AAV7S831_PLEWA|nr:hypothetical protein NDU88_001125 [Pleurodeles waltl]
MHDYSIPNIDLYILTETDLFFSSDLKTAVDGADETVAIEGVVVDGSVIDEAVINGVAVVTVNDEVMVVVRSAVDKAVAVVVVINVTVLTEEIAVNELFADAAFLVDGSVDGLTVVNEDIFEGVAGIEGDDERDFLCSDFLDSSLSQVLNFLESLIDETEHSFLHLCS